MELFDRRAFLRAGSLSLFGLQTWGDMLRLRAQAKAAAPKREISVIHVLLSGGMSHVDTLDMKPQTRSAFRSIFRPIETSVSGIQICDRLPKLAAQARKYTIIRSATHKLSVHERASYLVMSGHEPLATVNHPSMGAVAHKELGPRNELPPYISIPAMTGLWESAGMLPGKFGPFEAGDPNREGFAVRDIRLPMSVDWARMERRRSLLQMVDSRFREHDAAGVGDTVDSFRQTAYDLVRSPRAKTAFAIDQETAAARERYGRTPLGQGCLLARRLVEAGVRFVTVSNGYYKWDHHAKVFENLRDRYLPELDSALASLIEDLDQRGLLATTLVVATGEFGRTPEVNVNGGRDHWPNVFSILVAGAGVPGGQVWGSSDSDGMYVRDNPVEIPDLVATVYEKIGIDWNKEYLTPIGRPFRLSEGKPLGFLS